MPDTVDSVGYHAGMVSASTSIPSQLTVNVIKSNINVVDLSVCYFIKQHKRFNYEQLKQFTKEFAFAMNEVKKLMDENPNLQFKLQIELTDNELSIKVID